MDAFRLAAANPVSLHSTKTAHHLGFAPSQAQHLSPESVSVKSQLLDNEVRLGGVLRVSDEKLVSSDYLSSTESSIIDVDATVMLDGKTAKIVAWYDNEYGFANRSEFIVLSPVFGPNDSVRSRRVYALRPIQRWIPDAQSLLSMRPAEIMPCRGRIVDLC